MAPLHPAVVYVQASAAEPPTPARVRHDRGIEGAPRGLPRVREGRWGVAVLRGMRVAGALAGTLMMGACSPPDPGGVPYVERDAAPAPLPICGVVSEDAAQGPGLDRSAPGWDVHEVARGLDVPWGIAPTPGGRLLVTERRGRVVVVAPDSVSHDAEERETVTPWLDAPLQVAALEEAGLLGIALHPDFERTGWVYLAGLFDRRVERSWLANQWARVRVRLGDDGARAFELRVIRYTHRSEGPADPGRGTDPVVVAAGILSNPLHAGGALHFVDRETLLLAVGDGFHPPAARDSGDPRGSILRIPIHGETGLRPEREGPQVVATGVRNSQGIHGSAEAVFFVDHGPTGLDFEGHRMGRDELNVLPAWALHGSGTPPDSLLPDFGWPREAGIHDPAEHLPPLAEWTPAVAPAGLAVRPIPGGYELFLTGLRGQVLVRVEVDATSTEDTAGAQGTLVARCQEPLLEGEWGRLRGVAVGTDGTVWVSTSNRDGRGTPRDEGDDRILRLVRTSGPGQNPSSSGNPPLQ